MAATLKSRSDPPPSGSDRLRLTRPWPAGTVWAVIGVRIPLEPCAGRVQQVRQVRHQERRGGDAQVPQAVAEALSPAAQPP